MLFDQNDTLVTIGASLTDCERARPVGEGFWRDGLGNGYVSLVAAMLAAVHPEKHIRVLNTGIGGNTIQNLQNRWQTDVLDLQPDWVSVMIGANDANFEHYAPPTSKRRVPPDDYQRIYNDLIAQTLPTVKGMILLTPFFVETNKDDPMYMMTARYSAVVKAVAERHNLPFIDTQTLFDDLLQHVAIREVSLDRVHVNLIGHMVIARAFAKVIDL
jgi:lysophospholipase L1-like esterase